MFIEYLLCSRNCTRYCDRKQNLIDSLPPFSFINKIIMYFSCYINTLKETHKGLRWIVSMEIGCWRKPSHWRDLFISGCKEWDAGHVRIGERNITGWENITCKGPEEGKNFLYMKNIRKDIGYSWRAVNKVRVYLGTMRKQYALTVCD